MNWTEGSLNRHSRARKGKETVLRQKEHFAKVRAGLLDANVKISPPSVSVLAVPARPPSSIRHGALKSTSSTSQQHGNRLLTSRYFSGHATMPAPARPPDNETDEVTRQKRRRLLLKGDWVGTNVQKPIEMAFTKPGGSPSHPWDARKSRIPASKLKLRKLVGLANHAGGNRAHMTAVNTSTPTSFRQIKVRVGPYEKALGNSSNASSRSRDPRVGMSGSIGKPLYRHQRGHHRNQGRVSATISISSHRSQSPASQAPLLTTSPLLFHPVPTRPALLQLLDRHSADSDNADSTFAQVGAERPAVPPSEAEENNVWRAFVARPDGVSTSNDMRTSDDDLKDAAQDPVSPGVSQHGMLRQLHETSQATAAVSPVIGGSDEPFEADDQATPNAGDDNPLRPDSGLRRPSESLISDPDTRKSRVVTDGSSDEVSLLATPSSPGVLPSPDLMDELATFNTVQPGDIVSVEKKLPLASEQEDENDMWRNFVFGESSENLEEALEETCREIARSLRPPLPFTITSSCEGSQKDTATSSANSDFIDRRDSAEGVSTTTRDVFDMAPASHVATAGTSSADSVATPVSMDTAVPTDRATRGSSSSSSASGSGTGRELFHNELVRPSVCEADTGPATHNPERLETHGEADECFRFARPKLFVGKKMGQVDEQRQIALSVPQIRGTTQTRRRQRRANDGRANIKKLPNYGSDPIEEFEGDVRSDRAEKGSMFGPLDTESVFDH